MHLYTALRKIRPILNSTSEGNQIFGGPWDWRREFPIFIPAVFLALALILAGFVAAKFEGLFVGLISGCAVMYYAAKLIGRMRRDDDFTLKNWLSRKIDRHFVRISTLEGPNPFHPDTEPVDGSPILPVVDVIAGNIRVTPTGAYWAEYRIGNPKVMGLGGEDEADEALSEHLKLLKKVLTQGALMGQYKEPLTINEIVSRSFTEDDLPPEEIPHYSQAVTDSVDELIEEATHDPARWPHRINHMLAFYVGKSATEAIARRDEIIEDLPFSWKLIPATAAQMYWTWYAHCTNGTQFVATDNTDLPRELPTVIVDDGALSDNIDDGKPRKIYRETDLSPVVKITVGDNAPCYQAILTADLPDELEYLTDTIFLSELRHMGEAINWTIRTSPVLRDDAKYLNNADRGTIDDNRKELGDENAYAREEDQWANYVAALADTTNNGLRFTLFVQVSAATAEDVKAIATGVRDVFESSGVLFAAPEAGKQEERWAAMQPGAAPSPEVERHAEETTISEFAEMLPFTSAEIGHATGPTIGYNLTSGLAELVRLAPEKLLLAGRSAAVAIVASVGGGKSTLGKILAYHAHVRGYPWGAFDRSNLQDDDYPEGVGEWQKFGDSLPANPDGTPSVQTIDITRNPPGSLDPLKVWAHDPETAARYTENMWLQLEDLNDGERLALAEAVRADELQTRGLVSQFALSRYLCQQDDDPGAVMMGRKIASWEWRPFAKAIFKEDLPALKLSTLGTVIRTDGVTLPSERKVFSPNQSAKMTPEERYGPLIYLLGSLFLKSVFIQFETIGFQFNDECWTVTRNPVGIDLFELDIRDGRKRGLIPVFMTHDGMRDLKDAVFKLISVTFLGRAEKKELAISNAEWFDAMPVTDDVIKNLRAAKDGKFYMSWTNDDSDDTGDKKAVRQVAEIQTVRPTDPVVRKAMETNPKARRGNKEKKAA